MSELPQGWTETKLGTTLTLNYGKSLPATNRDGGKYAVYGSNGVVGQHSEAITSAPAIIVGRKGSFGEVHYSEVSCFPIDTTYYVDMFEVLDPRFAYRLLQHLPLTEMNRASAIPGLNREDAYALEIALPPLPEQRRIVAKVDGLTARTARARKELNRIPTLIARYKQRLLALAFSGELTAGWRIANNLGDFTLVKLASLCLTLTDGDHQAPPRSETGIPFITISAMNTGRIDLNKATRTVPQSYFDGLKESRRPAIGDVLFSVTGSVGIPALVETEQPFVFQRHIAILKPNIERAGGSYLSYLLAAPQIREQVDAIATGTAQLTVPLGGLREFDIPCPSKEEQAEIVRRIESAFGWLDRMAADQAAAARLLPKLDAAILSKAFRGQLVPQDPNDEPASVLLDRTKVERANAPKPTTRKRYPIPLESVYGDDVQSLPNPRSQWDVTDWVVGNPRRPKAGISTVTKSRQDDDVKDKPYLAALLKGAPRHDVQTLFRAADLPVADFYKQLAWEIDKGHIIDSAEELKAS